MTQAKAIYASKIYKINYNSFGIKYISSYPYFGLTYLSNSLNDQMPSSQFQQRSISRTPE